VNIFFYLWYKFIYKFMFADIIGVPIDGGDSRMTSKLLSMTLERFKSFGEKTDIKFAPLTIILGPNNSGKSSLIQSLMLLKQTLNEPRPEVPLHLDGLVSALNIRELTTGWPAAGEDHSVPGPNFTVCISSEINIAKVMEEMRFPDMANFRHHTGISWALHSVLQEKKWTRKTTINIKVEEDAGAIRFLSIGLNSTDLNGERLGPKVDFKPNDKGEWNVFFRGKLAVKLQVALDHFIPYLTINRSQLGPRDGQRALFNAFVMIYAQPLEELKKILASFQYLGATRMLPPVLYRSANVSPQDIGASGELAAQLLHRRRADVVHYLEPLRINSGQVEMPDTVLERPLVTAVNDILGSLSIQTPLKVEDVQEIGFRLLFGQASLTHVGRGLTYLLPLVELGLISDPMRFIPIEGNLTRAEYISRCSTTSHIAVEEPEAHLHPKVQSLLAHWLVTLALSGQRLIIETHSDHLVRRLRGLVARAGSGSRLEEWLLRNVIVLEVEQNDGCSKLTETRLTAEGGLSEHWPAGFMDQASDEDTAIFYAGLAKTKDEEIEDSRTPDIPLWN
jgi:predicted ATPase